MGDGERRWYDNTKVIWSLFGLVGLLCGYIVSSQGATLADHGSRINKLEAAGLVATEQLKEIREDMGDIRADIKEIKADLKAEIRK